MTGILSALNPLTRIRNNKTVCTFRKSPLHFLRDQKRYFRSHPVINRPEGLGEPLREFLDNGILVLPSFHDKKLIDEIHKKCLESAIRISANRFVSSWDTVVYEEDGIYRLRSVADVIPETKEFMENSQIMDLVYGYYGSNKLRSVNYLDYKPLIGVHDYTSVPHMDSWLYRVKVFTLLHDVTKDNAPLVFWKRSHLDHKWRRGLDYLNWLGTEIGSAGICPPSLLRKRVHVNGPERLEEICVTGQAGTVIIADTRAFHRASILNAGYRLQLVQKFME